MLRVIVSKIQSQVARTCRPVSTSCVLLAKEKKGEIKHEYFADTEEEFDRRYTEYFNNPDIDNWQLRTGITNLLHNDCIPEPSIVEAALRACRRLNDHSAAVRTLEAVKHKCGYRNPDEFGWMVQELRAVLDELGISTPQELGYHEPELWLEDVYEMHGADEPKVAHELR